MKILIHISTSSELISYEAISLAFLLASFDHQVQLYLSGGSACVLADPTSRLYGMIQSLDLYELSVAWADFDCPNAPVVFAPPDLNAHFDARLQFDD